MQTKTDIHIYGIIVSTIYLRPLRQCLFAISQLVICTSKKYIPSKYLYFEKRAQNISKNIPTYVFVVCVSFRSVGFASGNLPCIYSYYIVCVFGFPQFRFCHSRNTGHFEAENCFCSAYYLRKNKMGESKVTCCIAVRSKRS